MSPHTDVPARPVTTRSVVVVATLALLLAGCFTPGNTAAPPSSPVAATEQQQASKQTFLMHLIGLCAGVDERLGTTAPPSQVADELYNLVQQTLAGPVPDQDRDKLQQMLAALLDAAAKFRVAAQSTPSAAASPASQEPVKQAKEAMDTADKAARAYGMPPLKDCPKYAHAQAATWHARQPAPLAVQQAGSTVVDGAVWVVGGITDAAATKNVMSYDPTLNTWTPGPDLPVALHHPMAVSYHDHLVVLGGFTSEGSNLLAGTSAEVFGLMDGHWQALPHLLHARAAGAAVVVGDRIVVMGGRDTTALVEPTEVFDGTRWTDAAPMPVPGDHLAAVTDGTSVYAVGGRGLNASKNTAALQRYDPKSDRWARLADMPAPRGGLGAAYVDGRIITAGGEGVDKVFGDCNVYDITAGSWSPLTSLTTPRHGLAMAAAGKRIFAIGGATHSNHTASTDAVSELDLAPATSSTTTRSTAPTASPSSAATSPTTALGPAGVCPSDQESPVRACITRATAGRERLDIAFTVTVPLSMAQDAAHRHLHFYLANPDGHGGTVPDASIMQAMADHPGSWFNVYRPDVTVIDASTERGGGKAPLDVRSFSLLCVRVASGAHGLVTDRSGGLRTGNCVTIQGSRGR